MSKNKYANIVNRKNHSLVVSKPPKITKVLEGQALDGFSVEKEDTEYYLQRMANVFILPTKRRYKTSQMIKVQARMDFPTKAKKCIQAQSLENFLIERQETLLTLIDKVNQFILPPAGKFFRNKPELKIKNLNEVEYIRNKPPNQFEKISDVLIPQSRKKFDINNAEIEKFNSGLSFLAPQKIFKEIKIENNGDIFMSGIPKRYLTNTEMELEYKGERGMHLGLHIIKNEPLFIPNLYDMLLIQSFWENLEMNVFRITLIGKKPRITFKRTNTFNKIKEEKDENENENGESKNVQVVQKNSKYLKINSEELKKIDEEEGPLISRNYKKKQSSKLITKKKI